MQVGAGVEHAVVDDGVAGVAGGEEHLQPGPQRSSALSASSRPFMLGHHHVGEQQVDVRRRSITASACSRARRPSAPRSPARAGYRPRAARTPASSSTTRIVSLPVAGVQSAARRRRGRHPRRADVARQVELDRRALRRARNRSSRGRRLLDEAVDLAEPEAGALADGLGGEERIEGPRDHLRRHAACRCR